MLKKSAKIYLRSNFPSLYQIVSQTKTALRRFVIWRRAGLPFRDEVNAYGALYRAQRVRPLPRIQEVNAKAVLYVGTEPVEGVAQLGVLLHHGLQPSHKVLEIGCGALSAGYPIMQYVDAGNYAGIDPNEWLIADSLKVPEVQTVAQEKKAHFGSSDAFDASSLGMTFDFVISHSILSHAAEWQLPLFLENVGKSLKKGSKVLASMYFNDGNAYGAPRYAGNEKDFQTWQYPGISFFRRSTVAELARKHGYTMREDLASGMLITHAHGGARHSWILLEKR
jgi:2-polyprenyl-3-methyl-5-hydroxy-6-metoxy-1,4-benzoquinol methylase